MTVFQMLYDLLAIYLSFRIATPPYAISYAILGLLLKVQFDLTKLEESPHDR